MHALDAALPANDGIAWFNRLYLRVTEAVQEALPRALFVDAAFMARLDVVFAGLYFEALRAYVSDEKSVPRAWAPLFACRKRKHVAPLQFAFAGMNAHINHDLPLAVVAVCKERGVDPLRARRQRTDYDKVNGLLERTEAAVKVWFATGFVGVADVALGAEDDRV